MKRDDGSTHYVTMYNCDLIVDYSAGGKSYTKEMSRNSTTNYENMQKITLHYDPKNPNNADVNSDSLDWLGLTLVIIGVVLAVWTPIHFYLLRFDWYKAYNGFMFVKNAFGGGGRTGLRGFL